MNRIFNQEHYILEYYEKLIKTSTEKSEELVKTLKRKSTSEKNITKNLLFLIDTFRSEDLIIYVNELNKTKKTFNLKDYSYKGLLNLLDYTLCLYFMITYIDTQLNRHKHKFIKYKYKGQYTYDYMRHETTVIIIFLLDKGLEPSQKIFEHIDDELYFIKHIIDYFNKTWSNVERRDNKLYKIPEFNNVIEDIIFLIYNIKDEYLQIIFDFNNETYKKIIEKNPNIFKKKSDMTDAQPYIITNNKPISLGNLEKKMPFLSGVNTPPRISGEPNTKNPTMRQVISDLKNHIRTTRTNLKSRHTRTTRKSTNKPQKSSR